MIGGKKIDLNESTKGITPIDSKYNYTDSFPKNKLIIFMKIKLLMG
jgi:hypothetical protein